MPAHLLVPESTLPAPVLVVEDEPLIRQRLRSVLGQLGYTPDALLFAGSWPRPAPAWPSPWRWPWWTWACPTAAAST